MAAATLIIHALSKNNQITFNLLHRNSLHTSCCNYANKHYKQKLKKVVVPECRKLKSTEDSVSSRGFLRCQKSYKPPENVQERLDSLFSKVAGSYSKNESLPNSSVKYSLLAACFEEFRHSVPNSVLHTINSYGDLLNFYQCPVNATLPLDKMKNIDLPPNLHIQYEPLRFLPDEDTMFGGQTAFPKSNTLVSGLRTRRKYKGHSTVRPFQPYQ